MASDIDKIITQEEFFQKLLGFYFKGIENKITINTDAAATEMMTVPDVVFNGCWGDTSGYEKTKCVPRFLNNSFPNTINKSNGYWQGLYSFLDDDGDFSVFDCTSTPPFAFDTTLTDKQLIPYKSITPPEERHYVVSNLIDPPSMAVSFHWEYDGYFASLPYTAITETLTVNIGTLVANLVERPNATSQYQIKRLLWRYNSNNNIVNMGFINENKFTQQLFWDSATNFKKFSLECTPTLVSSTIGPYSAAINYDDSTISVDENLISVFDTSDGSNSSSSSLNTSNKIWGIFGKYDETPIIPSDIKGDGVYGAASFTMGLDIRRKDIYFTYFDLSSKVNTTYLNMTFVNKKASDCGIGEIPLRYGDFSNINAWRCIKNGDSLYFSNEGYSHEFWGKYGDSNSCMYAFSNGLVLTMKNNGSSQPVIQLPNGLFLLAKDSSWSSILIATNYNYQRAILPFNDLYISATVASNYNMRLTISIQDYNDSSITCDITPGGTEYFALPVKFRIWVSDNDGSAPTNLYLNIGQEKYGPLTQQFNTYSQDNKLTVDLTNTSVRGYKMLKGANLATFSAK